MTYEQKKDRVLKLSVRQIDPDIAHVDTMKLLVLNLMGSFEFLSLTLIKSVPFVAFFIVQISPELKKLQI